MAQNDNKKGLNNNNNFFNQNPLLVFAIFSIVIIIVFKNFLSPDDGMINNSMGSNQNAVTKNINYFQFKEMVKEGKPSYVAIGQTTIRAYVQNGSVKDIYIIKKVAVDNNLVAQLEAKKIPYGGYNETNIFSEILFSWV
ncbi:MAG: cell division protein FtsH, partial [Campylobacteraceae bacterium]|nr:cell division protein FtsH [Campylobacteraceae bacterium]